MIVDPAAAVDQPRSTKSLRDGFGVPTASLAFNGESPLWRAIYKSHEAEADQIHPAMKRLTA